MVEGILGKQTINNSYQFEMKIIYGPYIPAHINYHMEIEPYETTSGFWVPGGIGNWYDNGSACCLLGYTDYGMIGSRCPGQNLVSNPDKLQASSFCKNCLAYRFNIKKLNEYIESKEFIARHEL